jgi:hypothetical protein
MERIQLSYVSVRAPPFYIYIYKIVKDLGVIIEHFDKYPLITQKLAEPQGRPLPPYILFKKASRQGAAACFASLELIKQKEHLTKEGLQKFAGIKPSLNSGLSAN